MMSKLFLLVLSLIPLCCHGSYLLQAWSGSRLDKWDWIFYLLAIPAAVWAGRSAGKTGKGDLTALFWLVPMLFGSVTTPYHQVNAIGIAASAGVVWGTVWLVGGWHLAYRILPAAMILLLGTPSSSYQLSLLLMCPVRLAWAVKFLLALLCYGWIGGNRYCGWLISRGTLFFAAAVLASCLLLLHTRELYFEGRSFIPVFSVHVGDFWGRSILPDANTKRFFATSMVQQYRYFRGNADISVLAVRCGSDIHEIHPASHCLRTSMWTVLSEKLLYLQDNFAVTEIDARKGAMHFLVWVWYSSDKFSTPGFLGFRRHFQPGGNYYTYQISIPVYDSVEQSRRELQDFVRLLMKKRGEYVTIR